MIVSGLGPGLEFPELGGLFAPGVEPNGSCRGLAVQHGRRGLTVYADLQSRAGVARRDPMPLVRATRHWTLEQHRSGLAAPERLQPQRLAVAPQGHQHSRPVPRLQQEPGRLGLPQLHLRARMHVPHVRPGQQQARPGGVGDTDHAGIVIPAPGAAVHHHLRQLWALLRRRGHPGRHRYIVKAGGALAAVQADAPARRRRPLALEHQRPVEPALQASARGAEPQAMPVAPRGRDNGPGQHSVSPALPLHELQARGCGVVPEDELEQQAVLRVGVVGHQPHCRGAALDRDAAGDIAPEPAAGQREGLRAGLRLVVERVDPGLGLALGGHHLPGPAARFPLAGEALLAHEVIGEVRRGQRLVDNIAQAHDRQRALFPGAATAAVDHGVVQGDGQQAVAPGDHQAARAGQGRRAGRLGSPSAHVPDREAAGRDGDLAHVAAGPVADQHAGRALRRQRALQPEVLQLARVFQHLKAPRRLLRGAGRCGVSRRLRGRDWPGDEARPVHPPGEDPPGQFPLTEHVKDAADEVLRRLIGGRQIGRDGGAVVEHRALAVGRQEHCRRAAGAVAEPPAQLLGGLFVGIAGEDGRARTGRGDDRARLPVAGGALDHPEVRQAAAEGAVRGCEAHVGYGRRPEPLSGEHLRRWHRPALADHNAAVVGELLECAHGRLVAEAAPARDDDIELAQAARVCQFRLINSDPREAVEREQAQVAGDVASARRDGLAAGDRDTPGTGLRRGRARARDVDRKQSDDGEERSAAPTGAAEA